MPATCPACHAVYADGIQYCVRDGAPLVPTPPTGGYAGYPPPMPPAIPPPAAAPARASTSPALVGGLVGTAVVLAGLAGFLWMQRSDAPATASGAEGTTSVQEGTPPTTFASPSGSAAAPSQTPAAAPSGPQGGLQYRGTAPSTPARSAAEYGPARVVTDGVGLILREGPSRNHDVVGKMLNGDVVTVNGCTDGTPGRRWCEVVYGGMSGYASDEFLRIGEPSQDTDSGLEQAFASARLVNQMTYVDGAKVSYVNLREQPSVDAAVAVRMRPGTGAFVRRCLPRGWSLGGRAIAGSWCFVTTNQDGRDISGWASDDALFW